MAKVRNLLLSLFTALSFICAGSSFAQVLNNVEIKSQAKLSKSELNDILKGYVGREITVNSLQNLLNDLTAVYKSNGYLTAQAFYPEQESYNGELKIVVESARLNEVRLKNLSTVNKKTLYRLFENTRKLQNKPVNSSELNDSLLKIKDLNLFDIAGYFENSSDDSADLLLDIKPKRRFSFQGFYDNYGNRSTGENRFVGLVTCNDFSHHADKADLLLATTDRQQNNFSFDYRIPINSNLNVLGTDLSYSDYELGGDYKDLDIHGNVLNADLYLENPFYRTSKTRFTADIGPYYRKITDNIDAFDVKLKRHSYGMFTDFKLDNYLNSLNLAHTLRLNYGKIKNDDEYQLYDDKSYFITTLDGTVSFDFNRFFNISNSYNLQIASTSVDPSDKFSPCGAYGVKAFASNTAASDNGLFDDLKFTYKVKTYPTFNVYTDFMQAHAKNHNSDRKESFYAVGLGSEFMYKGFYVNASLNRAVGSNREYAKDSVKLLVKFGYYMD